MVSAIHHACQLVDGAEVRMHRHTVCETFNRFWKKVRLMRQLKQGEAKQMSWLPKKRSQVFNKFVNRAVGTEVRERQRALHSVPLSVVPNTQCHARILLSKTISWLLCSDASSQDTCMEDNGLHSILSHSRNKVHRPS